MTRVKKVMQSMGKQFKNGEKGFTLIELLVVVAILGVLAAVAVPSVAKFIGKGKTEAAATELANVQTSVTAAMADQILGVIAGANDPPLTATSTTNLDATADLTVGITTVGAFISGGNARLHGTYAVGTDGSVRQQTWP